MKVIYFKYLVIYAIIYFLSYNFSLVICLFRSFNFNLNLPYLLVFNKLFRVIKYKYFFIDLIIIL